MSIYLWMHNKDLISIGRFPSSAVLSSVLHPTPASYQYSSFAEALEIILQHLNKQTNKKNSTPFIV